MTKEQAYDSLIGPLMEQIIAICKEHKIPVLASFTLDRDQGLQCTTSLLDDDWEPHDRLTEAANIIVNGGARSPLMVTERNGLGEVTKVTAIL